MQTLVVAISTAFLLLASAANAVPVISLIWTGTNGTGKTGTDEIAVSAGEMLTLTIFVSNTSAAAVSRSLASR